MMLSRLRSTWVLLLLAPALASCGVNTVDFCEHWAAESCDSIADCCQAGAAFDDHGCQRILYTACVTRIPYNRVTDEDAARACLGTLASCSNPAPDPVDNFNLRLSCSAVGEGEQGVGTTCFMDTDCAPAGDFAVCWHGPGGTRGDGFCVQVLVDEKTCSFTNSTNTLHVCSEDTFCTLPGFQIAGPPPDDNADFSVPCKRRFATGESCIDPDSDESLLPCQPGLYCHIVGSNQATCEPLKTVGAACDGNFGVKECVDDLICDRAGDSPDRTCQPVTHDGPFCTAPSQCGDGICAADEAFTCPADCGVCGNQICEPAENTANCPQDCKPIQLSCQACACKLLLGEGGCRDVCDEAVNGTSTPNFCNGVPALPQCAQCIQNTCGDPANCTG